MTEKLFTGTLRINHPTIKHTGDPIRPCRKLGQGQHRVIIYINFVELESPMLHAKFQDHRTSGSGEEAF